MKKAQTKKTQINKRKKKFHHHQEKQQQQNQKGCIFLLQSNSPKSNPQVHTPFQNVEHRDNKHEFSFIRVTLDVAGV